ncbi:hypothetical protein Ocin01_12477 [Orchesella cincta]|uniref:Uncharacterized protein n=1 Tax=Orchesella cincta TaxID=48709 RepID=A0A1D2MMV3_ORCCI|nr:hypothetical protein Ocin01_12477 [Orchesella cincta]
MSVHSDSLVQVALQKSTHLSGTSKTSGCTRISVKSRRSHQTKTRSGGTAFPDSTTSVTSGGTHRKPTKWSNASSPVITPTPLMSTSVRLQQLRLCTLRDVSKVLQLWSHAVAPLHQWSEVESVAITNSFRHSIASGLSYIVEDVDPNGVPFISGCILANRLSYRDFEISTLMSPNYTFNAQVFTSQWQTMMWLFTHHVAFIAHILFVYKEALFITLPLVHPSVINGDLYDTCLIYTKMFFDVVSNARKKGLKLGLFIANGNLQKNVAKNVGFIPLCELPLPLGVTPVLGAPTLETLTLMVQYPHIHQPGMPSI